MDLVGLRNLLHPPILALASANTHKTIPTACDALGLPPPPDEGSKAQRMEACFASVSESDLHRVAKRLLQSRPPAASLRNQIQDILWADSAIEIPKRFRRDVAQALNATDHFLDAKGYDNLLDGLWILDNDFNLDILFGLATGGPDRSLRAQIERHVHRNSGDWSVENVFDHLGAFDASHRRFALFLEGLASSNVRPNEEAQRHFVAVANAPLKACGLELREMEIEDGYPVFRLVSIHGGALGRPKNLIFASPVKPDLRFRDAVNNDVEIVTNADKVLVYDRPIGSDGVRWRDLQLWWSETQEVADAEEAKKTLYRRLRESLPENSPPQRLLFKEFFKGFTKKIPDLPALLPEVWLHWDPITAKARGPDALTRFRMDFLMLLPHGIRVVIEVDGKHHYATPDGQADTGLYAQMVAADRDLVLVGYHVFRFGAAELQGESAATLVHDFFKKLFKRFGVDA